MAWGTGTGVGVWGAPYMGPGELELLMTRLAYLGCWLLVLFCRVIFITKLEVTNLKNGSFLLYTVITDLKLYIISLTKQRVSPNLQHDLG